MVEKITNYRLHASFLCLISNSDMHYLIRYTNLEWRGNVIQGLDGDFFVHPPYKSSDVKGNTEDAVARIKKVVSTYPSENFKNDVIHFIGLPFASNDPLPFLFCLGSGLN